MLRKSRNAVYSKLMAGAMTAAIEMRAQVLAGYLALVAFLGLGIGPSAVAAVTDFYFANDAAVGSSISIVVSIAAALSAALLALGIPAYIRKAEREEVWQEQPPAELPARIS